MASTKRNGLTEKSIFYVKNEATPLKVVVPTERNDFH